MGGAAGIWEITTSSLLGEMRLVIAITATGNGFIGTVEGGDGITEVRDIRTGEDELRFALRVTRPTPSDFAVVATIDGDTMTGTARAKYLPEAELRGRRRDTGAPAPTPAGATDWSSALAIPLVPAAPPVAASPVAAPPVAALQPGVAPGLQDLGQPAGPDPVALEFELPPPPPPGLVPPPPGG